MAVSTLLVEGMLFSPLQNLFLLLLFLTRSLNMHKPWYYQQGAPAQPASKGSVESLALLSPVLPWRPLRSPPRAPG